MALLAPWWRWLEGGTQLNLLARVPACGLSTMMISGWLDFSYWYLASHSTSFPKDPAFSDVGLEVMQSFHHIPLNTRMS